MSRVTVVTGAAGGIGRELCRLLLDQGDTVLACPRRGGSEPLATLRADHGDRLHEVPMDIAEQESIAAASREIARLVDRVDLLFNNAGYYPRESGGLDRLDAAELLRAFRVNAVGPVQVIGSLLPLLRAGAGKRLIQITSLMGSIGDNTSGGSYAYRMSKAALNMAVHNLAHELSPEGFIVLAIHPGWVKTRMGGQLAPLKLGPATTEVLRIALEAGPEDNGGFLGPGGRRLPF